MIPLVLVRNNWLINVWRGARGKWHNLHICRYGPWGHLLTIGRGGKRLPQELAHYPGLEWHYNHLTSQPTNPTNYLEQVFVGHNYGDTIIGRVKKFWGQYVRSNFWRHNILCDLTKLGGQKFVGQTFFGGINRTVAFENIIYIHWNPNMREIAQNVYQFGDFEKYSTDRGY